METLATRLTVRPSSCVASGTLVTERASGSGQTDTSAVIPVTLLTSRPCWVALASVTAVRGGRVSPVVVLTFGAGPTSSSLLALALSVQSVALELGLSSLVQNNSIGITVTEGTASSAREIEMVRSTVVALLSFNVREAGTLAGDSVASS